jgi:uncharacterized membrane protein YjgN (DUF898 family)
VTAQTTNGEADLTTSAPQAAAREVYPFEFRGGAREYFRIWIVNVLLSIITLGIYSAWAKVRNKRYFYGNTFVGGANFEYHANPLSILIARLIVVVGIIGVGGYLAEGDSSLIAAHSLLLLLLLPWAMVRGFAFNARNSSYRGVRFGFHRRYFFAYLVFYAPLLISSFITFAVVVGIGPARRFAFPALALAALIMALAPLLVRRYHKVKAENHFLGKMPFAFDAPLRGYISALWTTPVAAIVLLVIIFLAFGGNVFINLIMTGGGLISRVTWGAIMFYVLIFLVINILFKMFWSGISFARGRIVCDMSVVRFAFGIQLVNYLAIIFTLGLATPWARVRKVKYLAAHIRIEAEPELMEEIAAGASDKTGAFGEGFADAEGFDFDVGLI